MACLQRLAFLCIIRLDGFLFNASCGVETVCSDSFCCDLCFCWDWCLKGKDLSVGCEFVENDCVPLSCKYSAAGCRKGLWRERAVEGAVELVGRMEGLYVV